MARTGNSLDLQSAGQLDPDTQSLARDRAVALRRAHAWAQACGPVHAFPPERGLLAAQQEQAPAHGAGVGARGFGLGIERVDLLSGRPWTAPRRT